MLEDFSFAVAIALALLGFLIGIQTGEWHWRRISFCGWSLGLICALLAMWDTYIWPYFVRNQLEIGVAFALVLINLLGALYALGRIRHGEDPPTTIS